MIFKNLFRRKVRSILTLVGIAIGVATIVALKAMGDGLNQGFANIFTDSDAHLVLTQKEGAGSVGSITFGRIDESVGQDLLAVPGLDVAGMVFGFATVPEAPYFPLFGYDPDQFAARQFEIVEGDMLSAGEAARGDKQIILGQRAARSLGRGVGDSLEIFDDAYRVVGIYETGRAFEDGAAVLSLAEAQIALKQPQQVTAWLLRLENLDELEKVRRQIEQSFPDLSVSLPSDAFGKMGLTSTVEALVWGLSAVAMLVGGVGMMNTVVMSVLERTREIGALRSVGWRKRRIFALILGESLLLSLLGSLVGIGLGVLLLDLVSRVPAVASLSSAALTTGLFVNVSIVALGLGVLGGLFPAWWASRLTPLEAMRYEDAASTKAGRLKILSSLGGLAFGNLWRSKARSLFTIVGVGIGILAIITVETMTNGLTQAFSSLTSGADLMIIEAGISDLELSVIDQQVGERIAAVPGVQSVWGGINKPIAVKGMSLFTLRGRVFDERAIDHFRVVEGEQLSGEREILIGVKSAQSLGKKVGETLEVLGHSYRVAGIYETGDITEDYGGVIALHEAQELLGKPAQVGYLAVQVRDSAEIEQVRDRLEREFPGLAVTKSADFAENLPDVQFSRGATIGLTLLTAMVAIVGLMNTMLMSVFERTRQIGMLRAVGWRSLRVWRMILSESFALTLVGGVVGVVLSIAIIELMSLSPDMASMALELRPIQVVRNLGLATIFGIVGGSYPAWWALRLTPVEALRYE